MLTFVDANVFIRLFVDDDSEQMSRSEKLLKRAREGEIALITGPPVFFEVAWVLGYRYKVSNGEILDILEAILSFPNLKVTDKHIVVAAISLARETGADFADAYIAASAIAAGAEHVATFNERHFTRLGAKLYVL